MHRYWPMECVGSESFVTTFSPEDEMYLETATDDYVIAGVSRPGFPILLWEDMSSCEEVNLFLRFYLLRGAIGSPRSWTTIARALYDYFGFLEAHGLEWRDVERGEQKNLVAAYRD